jgi:hypothetical protein
MTDRYNAFIVILEKDIREDDAESTIEAIKRIKGVLDVKPQINDIGDDIAQSRVRAEIGEKLMEIVYPKTTGSS